MKQHIIYSMDTLVHIQILIQIKFKNWQPRDINDKKVREVMVFQQYFSYIMAVSFIGGGNQSTQKSTDLLQVEYTSPWAWFELTMVVVIGTECIGSCKYNYNNNFLYWKKAGNLNINVIIIGK